MLSKKKVRVCLVGSTGRMGKALLSELSVADQIDFVGACSGRDYKEWQSLIAGADVMVEVTHPDTAPSLIHEAISSGLNVVSGTSGVSSEQWAAIDVAARKRGVAVAHVAPMRVGGGVFLFLCEIAAKHFDHVEIIEMHHAGKADAPSGTAMQITERVTAARNGKPVEDVQTEFYSIEGVRGGIRNGIRVHSIRSPGVFSKHDVIFSDTEERITITYDEASRANYGRGALAAIEVVINPDRVGLISGMDNVLGLKDHNY